MPLMASSAGGLLERIIPNRQNRSLWGLIVGLGYSIILVGPIIAAFVYESLYEVLFLQTLGLLYATNLVSYTLVLIPATLVLGRMREPLSGSRAVLFAFTVSLTAAVLRAGIIVPLSGIQMPERGAPFIIVQFLLGLVFLAAMTAAVIYAAARERALEDAFRDLARANASLAHEEEAVRGDVFDQLHGSLQAQFVAVRRQLSDLAAQTSDPRAAEVARELDGTLDRLYRDGVGAVARALNPPGLEVSLQAALDELSERLGNSTELRVTFDPVATALDDPMAGGLHRGLRVASYRIVEEAVSNAMRHSNARLIDVDVSSQLDRGAVQVVLRVSHPSAEDVRVREGSGLGRMRARTQALGGAVSYASTSGVFMVTAILPVTLPDGGRWAEVETRRG